MRTRDFSTRLARLERENRMLKRSGIVGLALASVLVLAAQTLPQNQVVEAREFRVVDAGGRTRATLAVDGGKAGLTVLVPVGNRSVFFGADTVYHGLSLIDSLYGIEAFFGLLNGAATIARLDETGEITAQLPEGTVEHPFAALRERSALTDMQWDLYRLIMVQEGYFADHLTYTTDIEALDLEPSLDVTITIVRADDQSWSAFATHPDTYRRCGIFIGDSRQLDLPPAGEEGEPWCEE